MVSFATLIPWVLWRLFLFCINVLHMRMDLIRFKSIFNSSDIELQ